MASVASKLEHRRAEHKKQKPPRGPIIDVDDIMSTSSSMSRPSTMPCLPGQQPRQEVKEEPMQVEDDQGGDQEPRDQEQEEAPPNGDLRPQRQSTLILVQASEEDMMESQGSYGSHLSSQPSVQISSPEPLVPDIEEAADSIRGPPKGLRAIPSDLLDSDPFASPRPQGMVDSPKPTPASHRSSLAPYLTPGPKDLPDRRLSFSSMGSSTPGVTSLLSGPSSTPPVVSLLPPLSNSGSLVSAQAQTTTSSGKDTGRLIAEYYSDLPFSSKSGPPDPESAEAGGPPSLLSPQPSPNAAVPSERPVSKDPETFGSVPPRRPGTTYWEPRGQAFGDVGVKAAAADTAMEECATQAIPTSPMMEDGCSHSADLSAQEEALRLKEQALDQLRQELECWKSELMHREAKVKQEEAKLNQAKRHSANPEDAGAAGPSAPIPMRVAAGTGQARLQAFDPMLVSPLMDTLKELGDQIQRLQREMEQLEVVSGVVEVVDRTLSKRTLDVLPAGYEQTIHTYNQQHAALQQQDDDEPAERNRKYQEELMVFSRLVTFQAEAVKEVASGLTDNTNPCGSVQHFMTEVTQLKDICISLTDVLEELVQKATSVCQQYSHKCSEEKKMLLKKMTNEFYNSIRMWEEALTTYLGRLSKIRDTLDKKLEEQESRAKHYEPIDTALTPILKEIKDVRDKREDIQKEDQQWRKQIVEIKNLFETVQACQASGSFRRKRSRDDEEGDGDGSINNGPPRKGGWLGWGFF
uniref:Uncharacterized protein n=1 Tax=Eutreptiella gymnastica TaxID=73025 RepID=A0A7S1NPN6_9EUGL|mmetsp:Transcript_61961/g.110399  ORF Transcript_61961/g.110399 Transcript_61961/m.110399 type:complete len:748 (+) Transcript_61961:24-2267(+)